VNLRGGKSGIRNGKFWQVAKAECTSPAWQDERWPAVGLAVRKSLQATLEEWNRGWYAGGR